MTNETFIYLLKERRPDPRKNEPNKQSWFYLVPCPNEHCQETRWLRAYDARKGCMCNRCKRSLGGKASYAAMMEKDPEKMVKIAREYRLANPSEPERHVMALLKQIGVQYEREYIWSDNAGRWYILDFVVIHKGHVIGGIEVNGYWHKANPKKVDRDRRLAERWPAPLLVIEAKNLKTSQLFNNSTAVKTFVQPLLSAAKMGEYPIL